MVQTCEVQVQEGSVGDVGQEEGCEWKEPV